MMLTQEGGLSVAVDWSSSWVIVTPSPFKDGGLRVELVPVVMKDWTDFCDCSVAPRRGRGPNGCGRWGDISRAVVLVLLVLSLVEEAFPILSMSSKEGGLIKVLLLASAIVCVDSRLTMLVFAHLSNI